MMSPSKPQINNSNTTGRICSNQEESLERASIDPEVYPQVFYDPYSSKQNAIKILDRIDEYSEILTTQTRKPLYKPSSTGDFSSKIFESKRTQNHIQYTKKGMFDHIAPTSTKIKGMVSQENLLKRVATDHSCFEASEMSLHHTDINNYKKGSNHIQKIRKVVKMKDSAFGLESHNRDCLGSSSKLQMHTVTSEHHFDQENILCTESSIENEGKTTQYIKKIRLNHSLASIKEPKIVKKTSTQIASTSYFAKQSSADQPRRGAGVGPISQTGSNRNSKIIKPQSANVLSDSKLKKAFTTHKNMNDPCKNVDRSLERNPEATIPLECTQNITFHHHHSHQPQSQLLQAKKYIKSQTTPSDLQQNFSLKKIKLASKTKSNTQQQ